jgi:protein SCO1/2
MRLIALAGLAILSGSVFGQQPFNRALSQMKIDQNLGKQVPVDVPFYDSDGHRIKFGDLFGKRPLIVLPIFYGCQGICGLETDNLLKTVAQLKDLKVGKDYDVALLSINPRETVELARNKKTSLLKVFTDPLAKTGFHFLVGAPNIERGEVMSADQMREMESEKLANIRRVTDSLGFGFAYDMEDGRINHPAGLMVLTPSGRISGYIVDSDYPKPVLQQRLAMAESDKIGQKAEVQLLGCIMIDPVTGKKSLVISRIIDLSAGGFALAVFIWIGAMTYKSKKAAVPPGTDIKPGGSPSRA